MSEHTHTYTHEHEHTHGGQGHAHEHTHTYTHDHEGGDKEHTHAEHDHDHEAAHDHHHAPMENKDQVLALLDYTLKHNLSHADELTRLADKLKGFGFAEAADKVTEAEGFFTNGNKCLEEALGLLKKD